MIVVEWPLQLFCQWLREIFLLTKQQQLIKSPIKPPNEPEEKKIYYKMLEGLVANKLSDILSEYLENLNRDDLKISAGDINLRGTRRVHY